MPIKPGSRLLSTKEVAAKLGVHHKIVLRWVRNLSLPCFRFGKEFRFDESEVEAWVEKFRHRSQFDPEEIAREFLKKTKKRT